MRVQKIFLTVQYLGLRGSAAQNPFGRLPVESWIKLTESEKSVNSGFLQEIAWNGSGEIGLINTAYGLISSIEFVFNGRTGMHTKSKLLTITESTTGRRLPKKRPPTHPGEMLAEEFIKPLGITRKELAQRLDVSYSSLVDIIKERRSITPYTALRLSQVLGMSADFWLGLQQDWDLWHAMNSPEAKKIFRLKPIARLEKRNSV